MNSILFHKSQKSVKEISLTLCYLINNSNKIDSYKYNLLLGYWGNNKLQKPIALIQKSKRKNIKIHTETQYIIEMVREIPLPCVIGRDFVGKTFSLPKFLTIGPFEKP